MAAQQSEADRTRARATGQILLGLILVGAAIWAYIASGIWGTAALAFAVWAFVAAARNYRSAGELRRDAGQ